ncbi:luminal-binding protein 3-like [Phoenix dactylifera]|uniref:Luminal-binding protein 3-like n=1 Tax=Phoenix dactylifera TaxID=42345 RepID=A0A8B7BP26_PHODC|nr:luminal-binding protein 3-like [Phoenix dactylifera]
MDEKSERRWLNRGRSKNNTAEDKDAKKSQSITITNDKGRRSQEEIDRMVREAEMFTQEDEKIKERIGAKNRFENYVHNMKSTIDDKDELADGIESDDKETMESALKEAMEWLDDNQKAEKEDYDDEKLKELEQVCNPIIKEGV